MILMLNGLAHNLTKSILLDLGLKDSTDFVKKLADNRSNTKFMIFHMLQAEHSCFTLGKLASTWLSKTQILVLQSFHFLHDIFKFPRLVYCSHILSSNPG